MNGHDLNESPMAQPHVQQQAHQTQVYGTVVPHLPLGLSVGVREEMVDRLNQILADTMTLRDLYKKAHWQVSGPTFYQLHLLFDKHYEAQTALVNAIAERIQVLGGIAIVMSADIAATSNLVRPPRGREEPPLQIARLLESHGAVILTVRSGARRAPKLLPSTRTASRSRDS